MGLRPTAGAPYILFKRHEFAPIHLSMPPRGRVVSTTPCDAVMPSRGTLKENTRRHWSPRDRGARSREEKSEKGSLPAFDPRDFLTAIPTPILAFDVEGRFLWANPAAESLC